MKSNQPNSTTRHSAPTSSSGNPQSPSVPISVYRELAAELQATRVMVDSLNHQNQTLGQENQKLRQEIQRVVYSVMTLQPWIEPISEGPVPPSAARPSWEETSAAAAVAAKLRSDSQPGEWLTEEAALPQRISQTKPAKPMGGFWLMLTVLAITSAHLEQAS
ncbi:MAG: hypothetical protein HC827_16790 [Cyanobacteria bacterium RM1_2_2]|nr:hypothetical protein [Cyanobacteria bacterium RM1_2_2]